MSCSVCLSICLPPAAAFHPYCPQGFGNNFRRKYTQSRVICQSVVVKVASHVCRSGLFAPVIPLFHYHGCRSWVFAPVVLHIAPHVCESRVFAPVVLSFHCHGCRLRVFAPVGFQGCCPRTAARARSAQGASQFAAGYAAVRLTHHCDVRHVLH